MNTGEVEALLRVHFSKQRGYIFLKNVANRTGFASRYADCIAINYWPSRFEVVGVEIKVSRSDWLHELDQPKKADDIFKYCHKWFLATPPNIVLNGELPNGWGLLLAENGRVATTREPKIAEVAKLDETFLLSILRRAFEQACPEAELEEARKDGYKKGLAAGEEAGRYRRESLETDLRRIREQIGEYEKASGLKFQAGWGSGEMLGKAVNAVLSGKHLNIEAQLRNTRTCIDEALVAISGNGAL